MNFIQNFLTNTSVLWYNNTINKGDRMEVTNKFIEGLLKAVDNNGGKIPESFVNYYVYSRDTKISHVQVTPNTRVCVVTLETGHDLIGYSQVLDAKNDVELIGQRIAYENAIDNIWSVFGSIVKALRG